MWDKIETLLAAGISFNIECIENSGIFKITLKKGERTTYSEISFNDYHDKEKLKLALDSALYMLLNY